MPPRIQNCFLQVILITAITIGISMPACADDFYTRRDAVYPPKDESHRSVDTRYRDILHFFYETHREGTRAEGIRLFYPGETFFGGVTAQQIRSPKITYNGKQDNLESFYFFLGVQKDLPVTPFVEAGIDIGDWLAEELLGNSEDDEADSKESEQDGTSIIDYYFAIGIQARLSRNFSIRGYYKMYIIQQENRSTYVPVTGVQFGIAF
jgi:hypothetical protein